MGFAEIDEVKMFFNIEHDELDELLEFLIEYYSGLITEDTAQASPSGNQLKNALFLALGCHLSKTNPDEIAPTIAYTIGDIKERTQSPSTSDQSWCNAYNKQMYEILTTTSTVVGIKRRGLYDWHKGDL